MNIQYEKGEKNAKTTYMMQTGGAARKTTGRPRFGET